MAASSQREKLNGKVDDANLNVALHRYGARHRRLSLISGGGATLLVLLAPLPLACLLDRFVDRHFLWSRHDMHARAFGIGEQIHNQLAIVAQGTGWDSCRHALWRSEHRDGVPGGWCIEHDQVETRAVVDGLLLVIPDLAEHGELAQ